jgi:hypothetical protein
MSRAPRVRLPRWPLRRPHTDGGIMETERIDILKKLEAGEIDVEQAAAQLAAVEKPRTGALSAAGPEGSASDTPPAEDPGVEVLPPAAGPTQLPESRWASFWIYPMLAGGGVLILGALIMALVYATGAARGWLVCGWLPMLLGLGVILLALWTRRAPWLHVRVSEGGKRKIALSFPLPLTLAAWVVRLIQPFVPQLRESAVDELILALRDSRVPGEPLFVDVQDDEAGERVEVYFG